MTWLVIVQVNEQQQLRLEQQLLTAGTSECLIRLYHQYQEEPDLIDYLLQQLAHKVLQANASWLLKYQQQQGANLSPGQILIFYQNWPKLQNWHSQLHCLQLMSFYPVPQALAEGLMSLLKNWLKSRNKFVRAWSYNGMYLLAKQHPGYTEEVKAFLQWGAEDEAPSVKARLKKLQL